MKKTRYKKWIIVLIHTAAWILLFSLPYLLRPSYNPDDAKHGHQETTANFIIARITDLMLVAIFYLNSGTLMPKFLYKKKYPVYLGSIIVCFAIFCFASGSLNLHFNNDNNYFTWRLHFLFSIFVFLFILACSIAYQTIRDRVEADALDKERETENLKTELSLLRSQVSPHFMFNVLNNMVSLARKQSDLLEPSLIKLSSLMRYMLYETGEEKVSLEKETEYLQSYIDLQLQRFGKKLIVNVNVDAPDRSYEIEPMLLIPFVENAFKHGTGMIEHPQIDISLSAKNNALQFSVVNKYAANSIEIKDKASGIGLTNVKRRLELLYKDSHKLQINKNDTTFAVSLQIQLT